MSAAAPMALPPAIIWGPRLGVSLGARPPNIARVALEFEEFRGGSRGWHETPCLRRIAIILAFIAIILAFFGFKPRVSLGFKKIPCEKCYDPARFRDFWNEIEHF